VTFRTFRRSVATILDAAGLTAREIADQLGHSTVSTTQDVYLKARELHQAGENPQVGWSVGPRSRWCPWRCGVA